MNDSEFRSHVVDSLARLETNMESLIGSGKKGRIDNIEDKLFYIICALAILATIVLGPEAIALLK